MLTLRVEVWAFLIAIRLRGFCCTRRNVSGQDLARAREGSVTPQRDKPEAPPRLTSHEHGEHHITVPNHDSLRVGTLSAVLTDVASHFEMNREQLIEKLFS